MSKPKRTELTAGQWVRWKDLSVHPNKKATKAWAGRVTGTDDQYGVDLDWLEKQTIDGATHFDVDALDAGDIIKVSGASHSNKKHAYYRVEAIDEDAIEYERMQESAVLEAIENGDDRARELREEIRAALPDLSADDLAEVLATVEEVRDE